MFAEDEYGECSECECGGCPYYPNCDGCPVRTANDSDSNN